MNEQIYSQEDTKSDDEERRVGKYILGKTIGQGTFNKVKIARHIFTHEQVAIKMIEKTSLKTPADHLRLKKQLKILRKARHPNIIQLFEIMEDSTYYYLVTEYASREELFQHIVKQQKLTEFEASKFLQQLLNAIEYLHQIGVVHRDLKPENILLDYKYNIKIVDFGLSNIYSKGQLLRTACGSPCYAPPEMLSGTGYDPLKVDIWSAGIVLYAMCFGFLPFDHSDSTQLFKIIKEGKYELPEHASEELISLLQSILEVNPTKRATIAQIRNHKFCTNNQIPVVFGIIQGLSTFPFQERIQQKMKELDLDTTELKKDIATNKHNDNTATYYLLLQQEFRQKNQTIQNYYLSKNYLINRYKLIEKVKEQYERRVNQQIERLQLSRKFKMRMSSSKKIRSKTTDKKYHTGTGNSNSKNVSSKYLFNSPPPSKNVKLRRSKTNEKRKSKKKLKRT